MTPTLSPLTEEGIRATVEAQVQRIDLDGAAFRLPSTIWNEQDFRPSELARLDALVEKALADVIERARRDLAKTITSACITFARQYPDAPRRETP